MQIGCPSFGVEIVPARVSFCLDQKWNFSEHYEKQRLEEGSDSAPTTANHSATSANKKKARAE